VHPDLHGNYNQSLAEASLSPGHETRLHRHGAAGERYPVPGGCDILTINADGVRVTAGDTALIPPGAAHKIRNSGGTTVKILLLLFTPLPP